jgi:hypothetical protein
MIYSTGDLPHKLLWHIYDTAVAPIVLYGSEVWGYKVTPQVEKPDFKFAKMVLRLPQGTPSTGLMLLLDKPMTCYWKAKYRMLQYWAKLTQLPDYRLVKIAYYKQLELDSEGTFCWASDVRHLLSDSNMEDVWVAKTVENLNAFSARSKYELSRRAYFEALAESHTKESLYFFLAHIGSNLSSPELLELDTQKRRLIFAGKLTVPLFVDFATADGIRVKRCKLCKRIVNDSWSHIIWECVLLDCLRIRIPLAKYAQNQTDSSVLFLPPEKEYLLDLGSFLYEAWKLHSRK